MPALLDAFSHPLMGVCNPQQQAPGHIVYRLICLGARFACQITPILRIRNRLVGHVIPRERCYLTRASPETGLHMGNLQPASCYFAPKHCRRVPTGSPGSLFLRLGNGPRPTGGCAGAHSQSRRRDGAKSNLRPANPRNHSADHAPKKLATETAPRDSATRPSREDVPTLMDFDQTIFDPHERAFGRDSPSPRSDVQRPCVSDHNPGARARRRPESGRSRTIWR
jgi:hypothetical protein